MVAQSPCLEGPTLKTRPGAQGQGCQGVSGVSEPQVPPEPSQDLLPLWWSLSTEAPVNTDVCLLSLPSWAVTQSLLVPGGQEFKTRGFSPSWADKAGLRPT